MKNLVLACVVALAFCPIAAVADIAISTQAGWFGQAAADREMQEVVDNVTGVSIERFASDQHDALADWVVAHTGDGESDILILCGVFPDTIYPGGNAQPDDSIAELFLDDGNTIINTGDWIFYVNSAGANNAEGGLQNMMDLAGIALWGDDTPVAVTAEGHAVAPSLQDFATDRPFPLDQLSGDWVPELILAQNDAGTRADPVILVNTTTGGRVGYFYQTASQDNDPRGEVMSEWINNFVLTGGVIPNTPAENPDPADGAADVLMPLLQWTAGYGAVVHNVYFGETPETLAMMMPTSDPLYFHPMPLTPGTTYYWRVDEVAADGAINEGDVWSFTTMPLEAHFPSPYDGAMYRKTDMTFSWAAGQGATSHKLYGGTDEAAVAAADESAFLGEQAETSANIGELAPDTRYYWRIDEVGAGGNIVPGPVWTFTTIDPEGGAVAEYWANMSLDGAPDVITTVSEVNFAWGGDAEPGINSPDPAIPVDGFSCRWTAQLNVPVSGTYRFFEASDDGARMSLNGTEIAWGWWDRGTTEDASGEIELEAGGTYVLEMEMYENGGGAAAFLSWEGPGIPKEIIPQGALQIPVVASAYSPANGAQNVGDEPVLSWTAGADAVEHKVYFGTDEALVAAGDESVLLTTTADLSAATSGLTFGVTYYWKVDEVAADATVNAGFIASFTVVDHAVIDDFEAYDVIVPTDPVAAPIAQYDFEGDLTDSSGNGHDGTAFGDVSIADDPVMGQVLSLPGGDDQYVQVGEVGISGTMPTTIACWAKADNTSIPDWTLVFGFTGNPDGGGDCGSHFNIGSLGGPGGVGAHAWCWEETIFSDQDALDWHHYAMTYDGTTIRYFGDGVPMDTDPGKSNVMDLSIRGDRVHIGSRVTQTSSFPGDIDDARVYDYALSAAEIAGIAGWVPSLLVTDVWTASGTVVASGTDAAAHGGGQAMQLDYDNSVEPYMGDVTIALDGMDLTRGGADVLSVWVLGDAANAPATLYLALVDSDGKMAVAAHPNPAATQMGMWWKVNVLLSEFDVNLTSVASLTIGVGDGAPGGAGTIYLDDVRVSRATDVIVDVVRANGVSGDRDLIGEYGPNTAPMATSVLLDGSPVFSDRTYPWAGTPFELMGSEYIPTFNSDKSNDEKDVTYAVTISRPTIVWITVDDRIPDEWDADGAVTSPQDAANMITAAIGVTFVDTGLDLFVREKDDGTRDRPMSVFAAELSAGTYVFGEMWSNKNFYTIGAIK